MRHTETDSEGVCSLLPEAHVTAQVSVGWKEIYAVVERSSYIGIQMRLPCLRYA